MKKEKMNSQSNREGSPSNIRNRDIGTKTLGLLWAIPIVVISKNMICLLGDSPQSIDAPIIAVLSGTWADILQIGSVLLKDIWSAMGVFATIVVTIYISVIAEKKTKSDRREEQTIGKFSNWLASFWIVSILFVCLGFIKKPELTGSLYFILPLSWILVHLALKLGELSILNDVERKDDAHNVLNDVIPAIEKMKSKTAGSQTNAESYNNIIGKVSNTSVVLRNVILATILIPVIIWILVRLIICASYDLLILYIVFSIALHCVGSFFKYLKDISYQSKWVHFKKFFVTLMEWFYYFALVMVAFSIIFDSTQGLSSINLVPVVGFILVWAAYFISRFWWGVPRHGWSVFLATCSCKWLAVSVALKELESTKETYEKKLRDPVFQDDGNQSKETGQESSIR